MLIQTDLLAVKIIAKELLLTEIHLTEFSPSIVQHPFTATGYIAERNDNGIKITNLVEDAEGLKAWQENIKARIDEAETPYDIYKLINKPYALTFLKFAEPYLSKEDMSAILSDAWIRSENPNSDVNVSKEELISYFENSDAEFLMNEQEIEIMNSLSDTVTVFRGVTQRNADNINALSWTLEKQKAEWFANRFGEEGVVYEAQIPKENVLAVFTGRNEAEVVVNPKCLQNITPLNENTLDIKMG